MAKTYSCEICGKNYSSGLKLGGHITGKHNNPSLRPEVVEKRLKTWNAKSAEEKREISEKVAKANRGRKCPYLSEYNKKYKKGKTYEEIYGFEKAKEIKTLYSLQRKGELNSMFGKKHSPETKEKIRQKANIRWSKPEEKEEMSNIIRNFFDLNPERKKLWGLYNKGRTPSEETRRKQANTLHEKYLKNPELHPNHRMKKKFTSLELKMFDYLNLWGLKEEKDFERHKFLDGLWLDFYFPIKKLVIETDGEYWHQDKEKDRKRDERIISLLGVDWRILHIPENNLKSEEFMNKLKEEI